MVSSMTGGHSEFEKIVFHGLRHSSATYQLLQSGGDFKTVQDSTGHATAGMLMDTYAHTHSVPAGVKGAPPQLFYFIKKH